MVTRELRAVRTGFLQKFLRHILKFIKQIFKQVTEQGAQGMEPQWRSDARVTMQNPLLHSGYKNTNLVNNDSVAQLSKGAFKRSCAVCTSEIGVCLIVFFINHTEPKKCTGNLQQKCEKSKKNYLSSVWRKLSWSIFSSRESNRASHRSQQASPCSSTLCTAKDLMS